MSHITLIATTHTEKGLCNSQELFKIMEKLSPDVIFEETPPIKFKGVYEGTRQSSLETQAIKLFIQKYPATPHYPVDMNIKHTSEIETRIEVYGIDYICKDYSQEYFILSNLINDWSAAYGFRYLNTDKCSELIERKNVLEREILDKLRNDENQKNLDHEGLTLAYKQWLAQHEERENEMLRNIYNHMQAKNYTNAIFLVGAAHRKPIIQKIQEYESKQEFKLNWTFYS